MRVDLVSLVEAAYVPEADLGAWLKNLVRVADATISGGRGVFGIVVQNEAEGGNGKPVTRRTNVLATSYSGTTLRSSIET